MTNRTTATGDGANVLMHSWPQAMPAALDEAIRRLKDSGATFVRVDELDRVTATAPDHATQE